MIMANQTMANYVETHTISRLQISRHTCIIAGSTTPSMCLRDGITVNYHQSIAEQGVY